MDNYEYCAEYAIAEAQRAVISVLDYGCGAGQIVRKLRRSGIDAFGCDVFYEGGDYSKQVSTEMAGMIIRRIEGSLIPFPDNSFDVVINNQVMEHVEDMDSVLSEIYRVMKPSGKLLSLFPDKSVWREGHCGIPFLHWFPKQNKSRIYFALFFRALGLGYHKKGKGLFRWSKDFCEWLDKWTWYRSYSEIKERYSEYFTDFIYLEDHWLDKRLGDKHFVAGLLPRAMKSIIVRKLAGMVFICSKKRVTPNLPSISSHDRG